MSMKPLEIRAVLKLLDDVADLVSHASANVPNVDIYNKGSIAFWNAVNTLQKAYHSLEMQAALGTNQAASTQQEAGQGAPEGFALVPLRMTPEMLEVVSSEEGWDWSDLLNVAGAITEEQYEALQGDAASAQQDEREARLIATMIDEWYFHADENMKAKLSDFSRVLLDRAAQQVQADAKQDEREAIYRKVIEAIRLADNVGRSRQANNYAMNKGAVDKLVDLESEIAAMLRALPCQHVQADAGAVAELTKQRDEARRQRGEWQDIAAKFEAELVDLRAAHPSPAGESDGPVAIGEFVCGEVEHGVDGPECGDYEIIYTSKVLDEINEHHQGKSFGIYIDRAAMSREQSGG